MTTIRIEGDGFVYNYNEYRVIEEACFYAELEEDRDRRDTLDELANDTKCALISFAWAMGAVVLVLGILRMMGSSMTDWIKAQAAASMLRVSLTTVHQYVRRGLLESRMQTTGTRGRPGLYISPASLTKLQGSGMPCPLCGSLRSKKAPNAVNGLAAGNHSRRKPKHTPA